VKKRNCGRYTDHLVKAGQSSSVMQWCI